MTAELASATMTVGRSIRPCARPLAPIARTPVTSARTPRLAIGGGISPNVYKRDDRGDQGREPAHDRIGDRKVGAAIELSDQHEIDDMDERRRNDEGEGRRGRPRQDESGHERDRARPDRDDRRGEDLVARALDERIPQRMKGGRAKDGGQDAGTEVSGVGHERVTVMDSPLAVEPRGDTANRQRARAEARASFARVGARTEPQRLFETGGLRWRFPRSSTPCEAAIVNTGGGIAGGDSYSVGLTLGEDAEVEATTPSAERIYRSDGPAASIATRLILAAARAALLAASGDAGVSRARGSSGGSRSRRPARQPSLWPRRWCSVAWRWARPKSTRV